MENQLALAKDLTLENIISFSVQIPGVKVNRDSFLTEIFSDVDCDINDILESGPVNAGVSREKLAAISNKLVLIRTSQSSLASFVAGIPGGLAMAATIPMDMLQFFGMALRLAQELSYIYGAQNLWEDGKIDDEKIKSNLILYCGVMFGVSGAVSGVRVLTTQIAKVALKKIPQKALTKTFWYPIVKQIAKAIGVKITKTTVAHGVSKVIPIVGGVISGGLNFASMMPMANRLSVQLDKACFDYSDEDLEKDIDEIDNIIYSEAEEANGHITENEKQSENNISGKISKGFNDIGTGITGFFGKLGKKNEPAKEAVTYDEKLESIKKLKELLDIGAITQEEFEAKKKELLEL